MQFHTPRRLTSQMLSNSSSSVSSIGTLSQFMPNSLLGHCPDLVSVRHVASHSKDLMA